MPRGVPLSDKQKQQIYTRYVINGDRQREIAEDFGISSNTVSKVIAEMRKAGDKMAAHSKIVAGDKANGRLQSTTDPHRFEGTCVIGGKKHSKTFTTVNARKATEMWEKWCRDLRDEQEFMDMVERKPKEECFVPTDEPMAFEDFLEDEPRVACGYPGDPIEEIHPIKASDPSKDVIGELKARVAEMQEAVDFCKRLEEAVKAGEPVDLWGTEYRPASEVESLRSELEVAKRDRIDFAEGYQLEMHNPSYLLWSLVNGKPKFYGLYMDEDEALSEIERINEVAAFLGSEGAFEVEEVQWKA